MTLTDFRKKEDEMCRPAWSIALFFPSQITIVVILLEYLFKSFDADTG
jgi:hypothetical protein